MKFYNALEERQLVLLEKEIRGNFPEKLDQFTSFGNFDTSSFPCKELDPNIFIQNKSEIKLD